MNGVKYLLDTNILIGMYKHLPDVRNLLNASSATTANCGYSAITRMELLSYPGITQAEITALQNLLAKLTYLPLTMAIEDATISLRRAHRVKLPDAIIVATAEVHGLRLLTLDKNLATFS